MNFLAGLTGIKSSIRSFYRIPPQLFRNIPPNIQLPPPHFGHLSRVEAGKINKMIQAARPPLFSAILLGTDSPAPRPGSDE